MAGFIWGCRPAIFHYSSVIIQQAMFNEILCHDLHVAYDNGEN